MFNHMLPYHLYRTTRSSRRHSNSCSHLFRDRTAKTWTLFQS